MSFLFFLVYAAAAGGLLPLLESSPGSAQELKVKVSLVHTTLQQQQQKVLECLSFAPMFRIMFFQRNSD